ncbi:MAG: serine hydrolase [Cytophagales bacterium]|nr:serine hydrolase [Cytophagales bacterium]
MKVKISVFLTFWTCSLLLLGQNKQSTTNQFITYAYPITDISIDGDLSDWPEEAVVIAVKNKLWGADLNAESDLTATFQTGYSLKENALYFGMVIKDDDLIKKDEPAWNNQDTYSFYVNEQYDLKGSGIVRYTMAENFKDQTNPAQHWDPLLQDYISWEKVDYKINTSENATIIELKYTLNESITIGQVIGVGHMVVDQDEEEQTVLGWVGRSGKSSNSQPGRIGSIVFADDELTVGTLSGKVVWKDTTNLIPSFVSARSVENNDRWFYLPVSEEGDFSAVLPSGEWLLNLGANTFLRDEGYYRVDPDLNQQVTIKPEQNNVRELVMRLYPEPNLPRSGNLLGDMTDASRKKIDATIAAYMDYYEIEGASFAAWKDGEITHQNTYGVKNNYTGDPVVENTLFEVASITKPTFAFVVMRLYEKGIIDLDEPLYKHLEFDLIKDQEYSKLITARHVLSHQTGFPNWSNGPRIEFRFEPGKGYGYSGEGFEYLKRVLVAITKKSMNQLFQEELIEPLGLKNFYYQTHPYGIEHKSNGHYDGYPGMIDFPNEPGVAWSLVTTPADYMEFANAIHQRKGLKPATYEMMLGKQNEYYDENDEGLSDITEHVGLGWFIETTPYGKVIKHGGNNGDFMSQFKLYDDLGLAFMVTTNGYSGYLLTGEAEKFLIDADEMSKRLKNE